MHATAFEAKDIAKRHGRPLGILHSTVTAVIVARQRLDNRLVFCRHLHHLEGLCCWLIDLEKSNSSRIGMR